MSTIIVYVEKAYHPWYVNMLEKLQDDHEGRNEYDAFKYTMLKDKILEYLAKHWISKLLALIGGQSSLTVSTLLGRLSARFAPIQAQASV